MTSEKHHSRRTILTTGATAATAAIGLTAFTACSGGGTSGPSEGSKPIPAGQALAALNDVPVGESKAIKSPDGQEIIITRTSETAAVAFSAICTHQACTVAPSGAEFRCPCHGSTFDAQTGAVKNGPADQPLPTIAVKVENGQILTA